MSKREWLARVQSVQSYLFESGISTDVLAMARHISAYVHPAVDDRPISLDLWFLDYVEDEGENEKAFAEFENELKGIFGWWEIEE